jgi:hypothetical protein
MFKIIPHGFPDEFKLEIKNNRLYVTRTDKNEGWGAEIQLLTPNNSVLYVGSSANPCKIIDLDQSNDLKILICIAFHYVPNNIKYLKRVLNNIFDNYEYNCHVVIDTNTPVTEEILSPIYPQIEFIVHENLEHSFHLTWMHREYIKNNINNYDLIIYTEDDILIPFNCIEDFLFKIDTMWPDYIPSYRRLEWDKNKYLSADITEPHIIKDRDIIILKDMNGKERKYFSPSIAYQGFWMLPSKLLQPHINEYFTFRSVYREHAASFPLGPPPYHNHVENNNNILFLNKIPLLEIENGEISNKCCVYHLPNKYTYLYTIPLRNCLQIENDQEPVSLKQLMENYPVIELKNKYKIYLDLNKYNSDIRYGEKNNIYEYACLKAIDRKIYNLIEKETQDIQGIHAQISLEIAAKNKIKRTINEKEEQNIEVFNSNVTFLYPTTLHVDVLNIYKEYLLLYYDEVVLTTDKNIKDASNLLTFEDFHTWFNPSLFSIINKYKNTTYTTNNYVCGGIFGDVIYVLYVIQSEFLSKNIKGNYYIDDKEVVKGEHTFVPEKTFEDINSYILKLPYIESFNVCEDRNNIEPYVNLDLWRRCTYTNFINTFLEVYSLNHYNIPWLYSYNYFNKYSNTVFMHRSVRRNNPLFPHQELIEKYKPTFIAFGSEEYNKFIYKDQLPLKLCSSMEEFVDTMSVCKYFICNLTSLAAISMAMYKPYLCELSFDTYIHYIGLEQYNKDLKLFLRDYM